MKPNGTSLNTPSNGHAHNGYSHSHDELLVDELIDQQGDTHGSANLDTPLRADAFDLDDSLKIDLIEEHFREIMTILGLDLTDDSLKGTPRRVAACTAVLKATEPVTAWANWRGASVGARG